MNLEDLQTRAGAAEALLKAMASQPRLMLLCEMVKRERTVTQLHEAVGLSMSAVSQHLAKLREEEIVATRREAQTVWYSLNGPAVEKMLATLYEIFCAPDEAR